MWYTSKQKSVVFLSRIYRRLNVRIHKTKFQDTDTFGGLYINRFRLFNDTPILTSPWMKGSVTWKSYFVCIRCILIMEIVEHRDKFHYNLSNIDKLTGKFLSYIYIMNSLVKYANCDVKSWTMYCVNLLFT